MLNVAQVGARHNELWFKARMTEVQLRALGARCQLASTLDELLTLESFAGIAVRPVVDIPQISQWALNGWNTECVLRLSRSLFQAESLRNSLQWAFPQAYYSAYAMAMSYCVASGFTERSHRAVIQKFGRLALQQNYPSRISFVADGPAPYRLHNLNPIRLRSTIQFDPDDNRTVDAQIAQFLNGTRDDDLNDKKTDMRLTTAAGRPKRSFSKADWQLTSAKVGPTSLLSLLYRKRIKANYREIDTFLASNLEPTTVYDSLITVVECINGVHEALIKKLIGTQAFEGLIPREQNNNREFLLTRLGRLAAAVP